MFSLLTEFRSTVNRLSQVCLAAIDDPLPISEYCSVRPLSPSGDLSSTAPSPATQAAQVRGCSQGRRDREEPTNVRTQGVSHISIVAIS